MAIKSLTVSWLEMVWKAELPPSSKLLCAYLRSFMNDKSNIAWPSYARMMKETGLSRATIFRHLEGLEKAGWLCRERGSPNKNTIYQASIPQIVQDAINQIQLEDDGNGSFTAKLGKGGGSFMVRQGSFHSETGVVSPRNPNIQENIQKNIQGKKKTRKRTMVEDLTDRTWANIE